MTEQTPTPIDAADLMPAIDAAIYAGLFSDPIIDHDDGRRHVFVPQGFTLQDTTSPDHLPDHIKQAVTVDDRASLSAYANRFSDTRSILIADYDAGRIAAYLDWHFHNDEALAPQHATHRATLALRDSEEWDRWDRMEGALHAQDEFAFFIEENVADITDPDHSDMLEICRDLEATQGVAFKSGTRLESGDRSFVYESETKVKGKISVPTEIGLYIPLYFGEEPMALRAKFRFRATPEGLKLGFRWHRVEYVRQGVFRAMATQAAEETGLPVFYGRLAA